jgi:hypothetical protein
MRDAEGDTPVMSKPRPKRVRCRRSKEGQPFCQIRPSAFDPPELARAFLASILGGTLITAYGATPRAAREALEAKLGETITPYDGETARLLRAPFKRPGQDPGGKPRREEEPSESRFTMRFTLTERAALRAYVATGKAPSEAEAVRQGLRKLGAIPTH